MTRHTRLGAVGMVLAAALIAPSLAFAQSKAELNCPTPFFVISPEVPEQAAQVEKFTRDGRVDTKGLMRSLDRHVKATKCDGYVSSTTPDAYAHMMVTHNGLTPLMPVEAFWERAQSPFLYFPFGPQSPEVQAAIERIREGQQTAQASASTSSGASAQAEGRSGSTPAPRPAARSSAAREIVREVIPEGTLNELSEDVAGRVLSSISTDLSRFEEMAEEALRTARDAKSLATATDARVGAVEENVGELAGRVAELANRQAALEKGFAAETTAQAAVDAAQDEQLAELRAEFLEAFGLTQERLAAIDERLLELSIADANAAVGLTITESELQELRGAVGTLRDSFESTDTVSSLDLENAMATLNGSEIFSRLLAFADETSQEHVGMSAGLSLIAMLGVLLGSVVLFFLGSRYVRKSARSSSAAESSEAVTPAAEKTTDTPAVELDLQYNAQPDLTTLKEGETATWSVPDKERAAWYDITFTKLADGRVQSNLRRDVSTDALLPPVSPKRANVETKVREAARKGTLPQPKLSRVAA